MSQPFKLYRLQQVDSLLDQAHARLNEIEAILNNDVTLKHAQANVAAADQIQQEAQKLMRRAEEEVQAYRIKVEEIESSLYGGKVRNPKELQDLQKESAALKNYITVLEDRQLEKMIALEEAEAAYKNTTDALDQVKSQVASQHAKLAAEKANLTRDVDRMVHERQATISTISADDLKLYDQLRQQRRGVAVAKVVDNACAACGSTLTPAMVQAAHSPNQLARCSFCGRILYAG